MPKIKQKQYQSCSLSNDFSTLQVITNTYKIEVRKHFFISAVTKNYLLKKVSEEQLLNFRSQKEIGFVLKVKDILYYTPIPENLSLFSSNILGTEHCCKKCQLFFQSGYHCPKAQDPSLEDAEMFFPSEPEKALRNSQRIEKYDFITLGCETFHTFAEVLVIASCNKFKKQ